MNSRLAIGMVAALLLGCGGRTAEQSGTGSQRSALSASFRAGESGYTGSDDVYITNQSGGNGVVDRTSGQMITWKKTGTDAYEARSLVRFGNLSLPSGAHVTSATLTLTFENWWTGFTLRGYYLKSPWNAATSAPLGWLNRDTGQLWNTPGAKGAGSDVHANTSFSNATWAGNGDETKDFTLDPAIVQSWLDNPAANNHGIVLVNDESNDKYLRVYTSEDTNVNRRPRLTINYDSGAPSCVTASPGIWQNTAFATTSSTSTVTFDATPSAAPTDAVIGLSSGSASAFSQLATIVRFNPSGAIDARNGNTYAAQTSVTYNAGTTYHFRLVVDVPSHSYSIYVTPGAGSEITLGTSYAFRTEQAAVSSLSNWASTLDPAGQGTLAVCNFATSGGTNPPAPSSHPRIFLDSTTLQSLRTKAQNNAGEWQALREVCHRYIGGVTRNPCLPVSAANCADGPPLPDIGQGYQGDGYQQAVLNLGLCYQIGKGIDPEAGDWATRGADVLLKMTQYLSSGHYTYGYDGGYGIRNYGVGLAIGFDYLYDALSPGLRADVVASLNGWLGWFEQSGLTRNHPHANYFAGYYATKAYAAIATKDHNTNADALWDDFYNRLQRGVTGPLGATHGGVAAYSTTYLGGGGWYEGWQYGNLGVQNMSLPSLAAKTGKNIDLIGDSTKPYRYPLDSAKHLLHFSWPSRDYLDDRDTLHSGSVCRSNSRPHGQLVTVVAAMLAKWNDPFAPYMHRFARQVRDASGTVRAAPWAEFLFWDNAASELDYANQPKSLQNANYAAMRSGWDTAASWASFRAAAYVNSPDSTEQFPDAGAPAIVRGNNPLLVNPSFLHTCYGGPMTNWHDRIHSEIYSGGTYPNEQRIFNTFYNGSYPILRFRPVDDSPAPQTRLAFLDDKNGYVFARAVELDDVYLPSANLTTWTRDFVYLRPNTFVVYDRTTVGNTSGDQHLSWHFPPRPEQTTPPSTGAARFEIKDPNVSGDFKGAITTLLPANANISRVDVFDSHKFYRLEVRPQTPATDMRWLTVFDTASLGTSLGTPTTITTSNVNGTRISAPGGNFVVLFGSGHVGQIVSGTIAFSMPSTAATKVVIADLAPGTTYTVTATPSGGNLDVTVQPGASSFQASPNGVLYVNVATGGGVTAGN
jgi:hypothetical protein